MGTNLVTLILVSLLTTAFVSASFTAYNLWMEGFPHTTTYTIETDGSGNYRAIKYDGSANFESTNASYVFNSVEGAMVAGDSMFIMDGTFEFDSTFFYELNYIRIEGSGQGTILKATSAVPVISANRRNNRGVTIKNLFIDGNNIATKGLVYTGYYGNVENIHIAFVDGNGFEAQVPSGSGSMVDNFIDNIRTRNCTGSGFAWGTLSGGDAHDNYFKNVVSWYNDGNGMTFWGSSHQAWELNAYGNSEYGIVINGGSGRFYSGVADNSGWDNLVLNRTGTFDTLIEGYSVRNAGRWTDTEGVYDGIVITGNGTWTTGYVTISDCNIRNENTAKSYQNYAIRAEWMASATNIRVEGGTIWNNTQTSPPWIFASTTLNFRVKDLTRPIIDDAFLATYKIETDNTNYRATKYDGTEFWESTNASYVFESALNGLTSGRTWIESIDLQGNFTIETTITVMANTRIVMYDALLTMANNADCNMFRLGDNSTIQGNIELFGGFLEGNKDNQASGSAIYIKGARRVLIKDTFIDDFKEIGIFHEINTGQTAVAHTIEDVRVDNCGKEALRLRSMFDASIHGIKSVGCNADNNADTAVVYIERCGGLELWDFHLANTQGASKADWGIRIDKTSRIHIHDGTVDYVQREGIVLVMTGTPPDNFTRLQLHHITIRDASQESAGTYSGIRMTGMNETRLYQYSTFDHIIIYNEQSQHKYGIELQAFEDFNQISNCLSQGHGTSGFSKNGTNSEIVDCIP